MPMGGSSCVGRMTSGGHGGAWRVHEVAGGARILKRANTMPTRNAGRRVSQLGHGVEGPVRRQDHATGLQSCRAAETGRLPVILVA